MGKQNLKTCFLERTLKNSLNQPEQKRSKYCLSIIFFHLELSKNTTIIITFHKTGQRTDFSGGYLFLSCNNIDRNSINQYNQWKMDTRLSITFRQISFLAYKLISEIYIEMASW